MFTVRHIKSGQTKLSQHVASWRLREDGRVVDSFKNRGSIKKVYPDIKYQMV